MHPVRAVIIRHASDKDSRSMLSIGIEHPDGLMAIIAQDLVPIWRRDTFV
jgi:hypothetical protein